MTHRFFSTGLIFMFIACLAACTSPLAKKPTVIDALHRTHPNLTHIESTTPPALTFLIARDTSLQELSKTSFGKTPITLYSGGGETLESFSFLLQSQAKILIVCRNVGDIDLGLLNFESTPFVTVLRYIKERYNVSVKYDAERQLIIIDKYEYSQIILPPIQDSLQGSIGSGGLSVDAKPDSLRDLIFGNGSSSTSDDDDADDDDDDGDDDDDDGNNSSNVTQSTDNNDTTSSTAISNNDDDDDDDNNTADNDDDDDDDNDTSNVGAAERFNIQILAFSETTGVLTVRARPVDLRRFQDFLETEATERLKFVVIHMMFVNLTTTDSFERNLDLSYLPDVTFLNNDALGAFKLSLPTSTPIAGTPVVNGLTNTLSNTTSTALLTNVENAANGAILQVAKPDVVSSLLGLMERWGQVEVTTSPSVMTANGNPVLFSVTTEAGYWTPGKLNKDVSSEGSVSYTEEKPTFTELETVGLKLMIRPKIIVDSATSECLVELDIGLESSEIISERSISWNRNGGSTLLSRPLRREKLLTSRALLRNNELLLLAKLNSESNQYSKSGIPGTLSFPSLMGELVTSRGDSQESTKTYIIIRALLPKEVPPSTTATQRTTSLHSGVVLPQQSAVSHVTASQRVNEVPHKNISMLPSAKKP